MLSLSDSNNVCWSFLNTFLTFCSQRWTPFCWWESGTTKRCFWGFLIILRGNLLTNCALAIPLLKMYPKDTLPKIRISTVLFAIAFWSSKTRSDLDVCQLRLETDGVEPSPLVKDGALCHGDRISRVKWQVEKRTRWRIKRCSVFTFIQGKMGGYGCIFLIFNF